MRKVKIGIGLFTFVILVFLVVFFIYSPEKATGEVEGADWNATWKISKYRAFRLVKKRNTGQVIWQFPAGSTLLAIGPAVWDVNGSVDGKGDFTETWKATDWIDSRYSESECRRVDYIQDSSEVHCPRAHYTCCGGMAGNLKAFYFNEDDDIETPLEKDRVLEDIVGGPLRRLMRIGDYGYLNLWEGPSAVGGVDFRTWEGYVDGGSSYPIKWEVEGHFINEDNGSSQE